MQKLGLLVYNYLKSKYGKYESLKMRNQKENTSNLIVILTSPYP